MQKCTFSQTDDYGNKVAVNHFLLISSRHSESIPDVSDDLGTNHFNAPFLNNVISVFLYQIPIYSLRNVSLKKSKIYKKSFIVGNSTCIICPWIGEAWRWWWRDSLGPRHARGKREACPASLETCTLIPKKGTHL